MITHPIIFKYKIDHDLFEGISFFTIDEVETKANDLLMFLFKHSGLEETSIDVLQEMEECKDSKRDWYHFKTYSVKCVKRINGDIV